MGSRSGRTSTVLGTKQWHVTYVFVWGPVEKKKHAFYKFFYRLGTIKERIGCCGPEGVRKECRPIYSEPFAMPQNSTGGRKEKPHNEMNFW